MEKEIDSELESDSDSVVQDEKQSTSKKVNKIDKFLKKVPHPSHAAINITVRNHAQEFKDFREDGGKLFCDVCNLVVEHARRSTIVNHIESAKQKKMKET